MLDWRTATWSIGVASSLKIIAGGFAAGLLGLPTAAPAQDVPISGFRECGTLSQEAARLTCFDRALAAAERLASTQRRDRKDEFGLSERQVELEERRDKAAEQRERKTEARAVPEREAAPVAITAKLGELFTDGAGRRIFLLENGQLWRQTSNSNFAGRIRAGDTVKIERGTLSGYRLTVPKQAGFFGVRRVR